MKLKAIIVEDEPIARRRIRRLLAADAEVEITGECASGAEAVKAIAEAEPDLIFLDIQIPEMDGFEVIKAISDRQRMPAIIFTTAYDHYALRAFDEAAVDYLLKPFESERFEQSVERAKKKIFSDRNADFSLRQQLETLLQNVNPGTKFLERLVVKSTEEILLLKVKDIDWIESAGNYLHLHSAGRKAHILRATMSAIESKLDPKQFVRIRRSAIVNVERIKKLYPLFRGEYEILLEDGTRLTSSRRCRANLQRIFDAEL